MTFRTPFDVEVKKRPVNITESKPTTLDSLRRNPVRYDGRVFRLKNAAKPDAPPFYIVLRNHVVTIWSSYIEIVDPDEKHDVSEVVEILDADVAVILHGRDSKEAV